MPALSGDSKYIVLGIEQERGTSRSHAMSQNCVTQELVGLEDAIRISRSEILNDLSELRTTVIQNAHDINLRTEQIENDIATK